MVCVSGLENAIIFRGVLLLLCDCFHTTVVLTPGLSYASGLEGYMEKCRVLPNNSVQCERELYRSVAAWKDHKDRVDEMIQFYKQKLENLKVCRSALLCPSTLTYSLRIGSGLTATTMLAAIV